MLFLKSVPLSRSLSLLTRNISANRRAAAITLE
jgi:hypothetical protein